MEMVSQVEIRVSICGDKLVEGRVQSAITKGGVALEKVERHLDSEGDREHRFWVLITGRRSLEEIVMAVERVTGAAVTGAKLLPAPRKLDRPGDAW
jgi:hypothetical protein